MKLHWSIPVVTAGAILGGALYFSVPANADTTDAAFLMTLQQEGIDATSGGATLITAGHGVCMMRAAGNTEDAVVAYVYTNSKLGAFDSGFFVGAAEAAYCPWYSSSGGSGNTGGGIKTGAVV